MSDGSEPAETPPSEARPRSPEIDGLRGLAIALVLLWHYFVVIVPLKGDSPFRWLRILPTPVRFAWSGVDLFFVLSGYLIGGVLIDTRDSPRYFRTFYLRRAARILPLYGFVLAFAALCFWTRPVRLTWLTMPPSPPLWMYATFSQTWWIAANGRFGPMMLGVTWSLAIEEHFYLVIPALIRLSPRRALPWVFVALVIGALGFRAWLETFGPIGPFIAHVATPARLDALGLGLLSAWALRQPGLRSWLRARRALLLAVTALLGLGVLGLALDDVQLYTLPMSRYGLTIIALFYTALLWSVVTCPEGRLAAPFRARPLGTLGTLCFGVYLWHEILLGACHGVVFGRRPILGDLEDFWITVLALLLTLVVARATYRWIEAPFIARGHRLRY